jgi:hypothetical protein
LVVIDLAGNQLRGLTSACFAQCGSLASLDLSDNQLTEIPPSLWNCLRLTWLNIFSNCIRKLAPDIGKLVNLRELFAGNNIFTSLPKEMASLRQLKILHLAGNGIDVLDPEILMDSLERLYFSRNELSEFPNALSACPRLETIDLSGNKIATASVTGMFSTLQELVLSHNNLDQFSFVSGSKCSFPNLMVLDLSNNNISSVPDVSDLKELEILNLLHCNISHLGRKQLDQHAKLSIIYMQGNPVEKARDLRMSFVERKTDLLITDLFKGPSSSLQFGNRLRSSGREEAEQPHSPPNILFSWSEIKGARTTQEDAMTLRQDLGAENGKESMQL